MSKVEKVEQEVAGFSPVELEAFRHWFAAFDADAWDRQFEEDARSGKLDFMAQQAEQDRQKGLLTDL